MFPVIDKRETGINLSRIMTMRGITAKNVQDYLNLGCVKVYIAGWMVSICHRLIICMR